MSASSTDSPVRLYAVLSSGPVPLPVPPHACTAHEVLDELPLGVYTGMRTFQHDRLLGLEEHLDRTDRCMELLGWAERLDRPSLRRTLAGVLAEHPFDDAFVRIDVLAPLTEGHATPSRTLVSLSPLAPVPASFLRDGVRIEIARGLERPDPRIKMADFVILRRPYPLNRKEAFEHLLVDEKDRILEATSANFYAILDGAVRTADRHMLAGITRGFVLRLCSELGLAVRLEPLHLDELAAAEEAFLSSSTRAIVPVVDVAGTRIGDGRPGAKARALLGAYEALVEREARPPWPPPD